MMLQSKKLPKNKISQTLYESQFPICLQPDQKIAFVMSKRLGDSLLSMIVVNNLVRNGFDVTVYGDYISSLKNWFPWAKIFPKPKANIKKILNSYDVLLHAFTSDVLDNAKSWHPFVRILERSPYNWLHIPMVEIQKMFCEHELLLKNVVTDNHLMPPKNLKHRKYMNRVVIHPTSYEKKKNWFPQRFLQLAKILQQRGFQPEFIVSPEERSEWLWMQNEGMSLPQFASLNATAKWIYESGWFIGNDSGIGHLASNLGIPTLTLGMRKKVMQRWRPAWTPGAILFPPQWLFTRPVKENFWQYFISVKKVVNCFDELVLEYRNNNKYL